eukprot:1180636-Prorocentrum_minimum.AAC.4
MVETLTCVVIVNVIIVPACEFATPVCEFTVPACAFATFAEVPAQGDPQPLQEGEQVTISLRNERYKPH